MLELPAMETDEISQLRQLLNQLASKSVTDSSFAKRFGLLSSEGRVGDLKRLASQIDIDPEIVDNFDLVGIEVDSLEGFVKEAYFRYFENESSTPVERRD
jgi:hypothetical protein